MVARELFEQDGSEPTVADAVAAMMHCGYVALPLYFSVERIERLREEFDALHARPPSTLERVTCLNGVQIRLRRHDLDDPRQPRPAFRAFAEDPFLRATVTAYFQQFEAPVPRASEICTKFEVELNERPGASNSSDWHFDRVPSVKASVYLDDTDEEGGALQVVPGSHALSRKIALDALTRDPNPLHLANYFHDTPQLQGITLGGGRGTLLIFDTYCIHRGGQLAPHRRRRNIRGITWARPLTPGYFRMSPRGAPLERERLEPYRPDFVHPSDEIPVCNMFHASVTETSSD